jgi:hypothetical protein
MNIINLDSSVKFTDESSYIRIFQDSMNTDKNILSTKNGTYLMTHQSGELGGKFGIEQSHPSQHSKNDFRKRSNFRVEHISLDPIDLENKATIS